MIELIIFYISIGFIIIATCYYTVTKNHFEKRDMIHVPRQWFIGSMGGYVYSNFAYSDFIRHLYTMIRMDAKYFGYYDHSTPIIMIRDPEIIRNIKVINFSHFTDRPNPHNEALDVIFAKNLRYMKGDQWQRMRDILNPAFSPLRMAVMFDELSACAENFAGFFLNENHKPEVDMDDAFYKLACDMVGRAAFGIEPDSLRQPVNELIYLGTKCTNLEDNFSLIKIFIIDKFPSIAKLFNIRISQPEFTQKFTDAVKDIIEFRKNKGIVRHDMIQLMVDARDKGDFPLTMDEIVTQASLFFSDGLEVVTTIMCFVTYLIAVSPEAQAKLRKEIDETHEMCGGKLTYAILNGMPYLEAVIYETLRMYPYEPVITRVCTKTYDLPPCFPDDQAPQVLIPGDIVAFPICGLHRDPKHFPEPDSFDPERFIKNATETYLNPVYMPFGLGPRSCIGMRLAMLEVKLMLYHLLLKLTLEPAKRMIVPLRLQYGTIPPTAQGGFWLKIRSRDEGANLAFNSGTEEEEEEEAEAALSPNL